MSTLIVHVGCPKTGTTALQRHLFPALSSLAYFGKNTLADPIYTPQSFEELIRDVIVQPDPFFRKKKNRHAENDRRQAVEQSRVDRFLISSEGIVDDTRAPRPAPWPKDIYLKTRHLHEAVTAEFGDIADIEIMITIRRQEDALPSLFAQIPYKYPNLYDGNIDSFVEFCLFEKAFGFAEFMDYEYLYRIYAEIFGPERVWVFPMEGLFTSAASPEKARLAKLFSTSEDEITRTLVGTETNVKRQQGKAETVYNFGRRAHPAIESLGRVYRTLSKGFGHDIAQIPAVGRVKSLVSQKAFSPDNFVLTEEIRSKIRTFYGDSNDRLDDILGGVLRSYRYPSRRTVGRSCPQETPTGSTVAIDKP